MSFKHSKTRQGFTLTELMVVILIIIILMGLAIPFIRNVMDRAKDTEVSANLNQIVGALEQYKIDHSYYPGLHWVVNQTTGNLECGPGVLGATEFTVGSRDFTNVNNASVPDFQGFFEMNAGKPINVHPWAPGNDGTGAARRAGGIDALQDGGYIKDYPRNPFIAGNGSKNQMANTFLFRTNSQASSTTCTIDSTNRSMIDFNIFTTNAGSPLSTMKGKYSNYGRGFFTYVPLGPLHSGANSVNGMSSGLPITESGTTITAGAWDDPSPGPTADDNQVRSQFYSRCTSYMLIGWGSTRLNDSQKGWVGKKYSANAVNPYGGPGGFDIDNNGKIDFLEQAMFPVGNTPSIIAEELQDSKGVKDNTFGAPDPLTAVPIYESAVFGANRIVVGGQAE